jgi:hypothetical protein
MQNYMFIDIDGPLLPGKMHLFKQNKTFLKEFGHGNTIDVDALIEKFPPMFDPYAVAVHNWLAEAGNAKIVLVTNWRMWFSIEELMKIFADQGLVFDYADRPSCMKRGLSSTRLHDVSMHISDYLPENSRALVIDDASELLTLNEWFNDDNECDSNQDRLKKNIEFKLLHVDYSNGLTHQQVMEGARFFGIPVSDWDNEYEGTDFRYK